MRKKNLVIILAACLMAAILTIGGTVAWLTDKAEATNQASIGNVDIEVVQPNWDSSEAVNIWPGKVTTKDPRVLNSGKNPSYVRVKVVLDSALNDYLTFDFDVETAGSKWFKEGDYYYYKEVLPPSASTSPLFTYFELSEAYIEPPVGTSPAFDIFVYAEAVQSQGFEPVDNSEASFKDAILGAFEAYEAQEN